eukprot:CAMPEP_0198141394 /NCGR_PEP_ID=MMETSP1443-20131203/4414_1 /TAXON_ID=186043 /ORGANISM="Entomoneis sp., Strain CCMP2396" /LENGTH=283 /DNA_ID=CAMNT_0043804135 /DNA_START=390 /DNA_END=1242 /DNA_ORIENTATION=+
MSKRRTTQDDENDNKNNSNQMTQQTTTTTTRFVTNKMCPFAQKAWIALETRQVPFEMQEISLYGANGKPDWFWKLNPQGTVPVVVVVGVGEETNTNLTTKKMSNAQVCCWSDSDLILDHIDDLPLRSDNDNGSRKIELYPAELREDIDAWRFQINQELLPLGKKAVFSNSMSQELKTLLQKMEDSLASPVVSTTSSTTTTATTTTTSPASFLTGSTLTVADCHAFPFLWRLDTEFDFSCSYPNLTNGSKPARNYLPFRKQSNHPGGGGGSNDGDDDDDDVVVV